jgi:predicted DNA-binding protein YlxM (UPF0122 family)
VLKPELRKRRSRMVNLIAMGNGLDAIVDALSDEFKVSKVAIYADYERMEMWVHDLQADEQLCAKLKQRLEFLNRTAIDMLLDLNSSKDGKKRQLTVNEQFVKIGTINAILKVTVEQIKLGQELGLIERKPEVIQSAVSLSLPFESSPEIRAAYVKFAEAQRAEKDAATKAEP